jgi:ribosomal-protein-alanine N-acetyltransferase
MSDTVQLRLATLADAAQIAVMSRQLIETGLDWSWTPSRVTRNLRRPEIAGFVAHLGSRMVGFALMHFGDEEANLNLLAVHPRHQGEGIGRRMVEWLEASALVAGISVIYLQVRASNRAAQAFYRKLGYRKVSHMAGYYSGREAALCMARDLWCAAPDKARQ